MNFPAATNEHFNFIGELGRAEVRAGRRYLVRVVTINNTTFEQSRRYDFLPAPDVSHARAAHNETVMDIEPVLYFGPELG
jgi:hypothetical protein